jgi:hypothetical protein
MQSLKESIEDLSMELSHGSGTCLPQESKGSGTRSGSKCMLRTIEQNTT